jgi:hypothetical protein
MWNPQADMDAILADFTRKPFGRRRRDEALL